jgi:hypothetical protein
MRRIAIALTGMALAFVPASSAAGDYYSDLESYSQIRDQLYSCNLDINWGQLSSERRAECDTLFGKYVLFAYPWTAAGYYIHCRSASDCLPTPDGFPDAAGPIPSGADVYDVKPSSSGTSKAKAARHHRHSRHHHR